MSLTLPRNQIVQCDCVEGMARLPEACIPLTVTSPPYDGVFKFDGHLLSFDKFKQVADQLWRVTMPGGVVCWEVKDQYKNGLTGTKYRQAIYFMDLGFRLHEELFVKNSGITHHSVRHGEQVHMVFVYSKDKPRTFNPICDRLNKTVGDRQSLRRRYSDGRRREWKSEYGVVPTWGLRSHLWEISFGHRQTTKDDLGGFVAPMAERLAGDLITSYSVYGDLVLDPFSGLATTAKMAILSHRNYLGFEVNKKYHRQSLARLECARVEYQHNLDSVLGVQPNRQQESK